jgi:hypothetical protein
LETAWESWLPSSHLMGYMEATESLKYPFVMTRDTSPSRAVLEVFKLSPSDGCPATATYLASTQALRSRRVSSTSKIPDCVVAHRSDRCTSPVRPVPTGQTHRSDRFGTAAALSSVLRSVSYGHPWARYLSGYQDRLLGGPLGLHGLRYTPPDGVEQKDYEGEVLG